jgi:Apea-like HEPN
MQHELLKARHRQIRDHGEGFSKSMELRVHRALSWLKRAEELAEEDLDSSFILLWIAFNAAYATQIEARPADGEAETFRQFLERLHALDTGSLLANLAWEEFSGPIRLLLDNQYVFPPFWEFQQGRLSDAAWREHFEGANRAARKALERQDTVTLLAIVLRRVYTLRNQMVHGSATWDGAVNRPQLRDCQRLLSRLVPIIITLMLDHPQADFGSSSYPVVDSPAQARA